MQSVYQQFDTPATDLYTSGMLSYRHAFHAGNHADVLKHLVLTCLLDAFTAKEKPFTWIDSHAGAGMYRLDSTEARTTCEADQGIRLLVNDPDVPDAAKPYIQLCRSQIAGGLYPGSPAIVRHFLRRRDQLILCELHTAEIENLRRNLGGDSRIHIHHRDGFDALTALTPPEPRRGLAFMDPSYELPQDYQRTADACRILRRRWPAATIVLWFPVVGRRARELERLRTELYSLSAEVSVLEAVLNVSKPDPETGSLWGMTGSGLFIIQPPWKLHEDLSVLLPWLSSRLSAASPDRMWELAERMK